MPLDNCRVGAIAQDDARGEGVRFPPRLIFEVIQPADSGRQSLGNVPLGGRFPAQAEGEGLQEHGLLIGVEGSQYLIEEMPREAICPLAVLGERKQALGATPSARGAFPDRDHPPVRFQASKMMAEIGRGELQNVREILCGGGRAFF